MSTVQLPASQPDSLLEDFIAWFDSRYVRETGRSPAAKTLTGYEMRLRGVMRIGSVESSELLATLLGSRPAWSAVLEKLYARQAPGTISGEIHVVRRFAEYAVAKGLIPSHAVDKDDGPRSVPQKPIVVYSDDEVAKLLLYAKASGNLRFWMLLTTLAETGRRVGELLALRFEDLKLDATPPHLDLPTTKNKRQCYVPLTKLLREEVWTAANIAKLKTKGHANMGKPRDEYPFGWGYKSVQHHLKKVCEAAGIEYRAFHVFRHSRATRLIAKGVPIAGVSSLLGHSSVATTDRLYSHVSALDFTKYID